MQQLQTIKQRFGIMGNSPMLEHALETALRVASTDLTVLITGQSGVGKEAFSKIIHSLSNRKHNPFIAINTGAITPGTINSELFGHEKGSFTGAMGERKGYFETVNGGTIFLDEIGEMPLDTQAYLLRILESGEFLRVGSSQVLKTNVRIIAATNVDLLTRIRQGKFREDLYYRLNTVPIKVPSLSERQDDIPMLFRKFASDFAEKYRIQSVKLTEQAMEVMKSYPWPGNIRELKNTAEQLSILAEDRILDAEQLVGLLPVLSTRNLPAISKHMDSGSDGSGFYERELLYKLLFEMKKDLNDLKGLIFELVNSNDLHMPDMKAMVALQNTELHNFEFRTNGGSSKESNLANRMEIQDDYDERPRLIVDKKDKNLDGFDKMEVVEANLSLEDMEKDLINKSLKKHKGKRKEAADELGISERTLYRKIKQYDISL